jgi:membrane-bound metal-dependent hydrolase YbcI (DUF457 family)
MLGQSHAISGALGWFAIAPAVSAAVGTPLSGSELVIGGLVTAGAALLPDLDHPQATVSHFLGPVSVAVSRVVNTLAGGHRQATHSLLFAGLVGAATSAAGAAFGRDAVLVLLFFMAGLALRGLGIAPPRKNAVAAGIAVACEAAVIVWAADRWLPPGVWWWLPGAMVLGCLLHVTGDCCTPERCPIFWPSKKRYGIGIISHTGNFAEKAIVAPVMTALLMWLVYARVFAPMAGHAFEALPLR